MVTSYEVTPTAAPNPPKREGAPGLDWPIAATGADARPVIGHDR
ncbi:hypothetical protein ACWD1Y_37755 [Streptomyces sp. NPDC002814]